MSRVLAFLAMSCFAALCIASLPAALSAQESSGANAGVAQATVPAARGSAKVSVAIATRAFQRGDTVRAGDFTITDTTVVWRWSMPPQESERVQAGWVAQRAIAAGEVLRPPSVQPPAVITSGSTVKVIFADGPVQIVLSGVAVGNAALGAPVGVRIDRTRRLDGIAVAPNTVRLR